MALSPTSASPPPPRPRPPPPARAPSCRSGQPPPRSTQAPA
eukprot:CAMPEP_0173467284 /NCGR_PEP_ID=MMETSP1357-20121228/74809_1 /TAXON_ID=77926 /ORGANISM="Hemiselmis rufescens, Strain PCC563" /LENGTH=40 /DNA_ID= /DNA_START= /DNA_END= /DNA_ORIENTATION=